MSNEELYPITFRIIADHYYRLKELAERDERSLSGYTRRLVRDGLEREEHDQDGLTVMRGRIKLRLDGEAKKSAPAEDGEGA